MSSEPSNVVPLRQWRDLDSNIEAASGRDGATAVATPATHQSDASPRELPSLWQLQVFEAVARHESVSQAATALLRSQPAVTSCLAKFEALLGVSMLERSTTGTYLTPAGLAALVRTKRILHAATEAITQLGSTRNCSPHVLLGAITRTQMRYLIAIEEAGSFRAAARTLGIGEASLQRAARMLEQNLGAKLFRRTASSINTTEAGKELARRLRHITDQIAAMVDVLTTYEPPKERCVTLGVLLLDPTILIVKTIRELSAQFPDARVVVISGTYDALLTKLLRGEIDFMFGILKHPDPTYDFVEEPLYRERYCVVARRDHPLARSTSVTSETLKSYQWVLPPKGSPRREAYEHMFSEGTPPTASIETYSLSTMRVTLSDSDMLTVMSWTEILTERQFGFLDPLPFEIPWDGALVGITTRREMRPNEIQSAFLTHLKRNAIEIVGDKARDAASLSER